MFLVDKHKNMGNDEFAGNVDIVEIYENNMDDFNKIMEVAANINNNGLQTTA